MHLGLVPGLGSMTIMVMKMIMPTDDDDDIDFHYNNDMIDYGNEF